MALTFKSMLTILLSELPCLLADVGVAKLLALSVRHGSCFLGVLIATLGLNTLVLALWMDLEQVYMAKGLKYRYCWLN